MYTLPKTGFLRIPHILGDPKADPPVPPLIPVKRSTWWMGVRSGRFPSPVRLGPRVTAWRVEDIRSLIDRLGAPEKPWQPRSAAGRDQSTLGSPKKGAS
jgi:predicted DNA-binding transcriptional regulator AlpA